MTRRFLPRAAAAAALSLAAFSLADAQAQGQGQPRQGQAADVSGQGVRRGPGGRGGGFLFGLRGVDLTEEQRARIRAIHEAERQGGSSTGRRGGADAGLRATLQAELLADVPDAHRIAELQQQLAEAHAAHLAREVAIQQKVAQVLTADQRAELRDRLARRSSRQP
jgi:Spy/CpxP family protein refolding chaperone